MIVNSERMADVKTELTKLLIVLPNAKNKLSTMDVPFEFDEYYTFGEITNDIVDLIKEIEGIRDWVEGKRIALEKAEEANAKLLGGGTGGSSEETNENNGKSEIRVNVFSEENARSQGMVLGQCSNIVSSSEKNGKITVVMSNGVEITMDEKYYDTFSEAAKQAKKDPYNTVISAEPENMDEITKNWKFKATMASIGNGVVSFGNAALNIGEGVFDMVGNVTNALWCVPFAVDDTLTGIVTGDWSYTNTKFEWSKGMEAAEADLSGTVEDAFYSTDAGETLDNASYPTFRRDGAGYQLIGAGTELAGWIVSPETMALSLGGQKTEEYYTYKKANSVQGIEELHAEGKISDEEYSSIMDIRNMSEEEFEALKLSEDYTEEDLKVFEDIRNMPEEWKTAGNFFGGTAYGGAHAIFAYGISKWASKSPIANTAVDIADVPFGTVTDILGLGMGPIDAFEKNGGVEGMVTSLVFSGISNGTNVKAEVDFAGNTGAKVVKDASVTPDFAKIMNYDSVNDPTTIKTGEILQNNAKTAYKNVMDYQNKTGFKFDKNVTDRLLLDCTTVSNYSDWEECCRVVTKGQVNPQSASAFNAHFTSKTFLGPKSNLRDAEHEMNHGLGNMFHLAHRVDRRS